jgi:hypothetical protein
MGQEIFLSSLSRLTLMSNLPSIQCVPGVPFLGIKLNGREADHLLPSSDNLAFDFTAGRKVREQP